MYVKLNLDRHYSDCHSIVYYSSQLREKRCRDYCNSLLLVASYNIKWTPLNCNLTLERAITLPESVKHNLTLAITTMCTAKSKLNSIYLYKSCLFSKSRGKQFKYDSSNSQTNKIKWTTS